MLFERGIIPFVMSEHSGCALAKRARGKGLKLMVEFKNTFPPERSHWSSSGRVMQSWGNINTNMIPSLTSKNNSCNDDDLVSLILSIVKVIRILPITRTHCYCNNGVEQTQLMN